MANASLSLRTRDLLSVSGFLVTCPHIRVNPPHLGNMIYCFPASLFELHNPRNEFGEVGIDDSLIEGSSMAMEENIIEMNNGCICCTVRGDLIAGLKKLIKNSMKSGHPVEGRCAWADRCLRRFFGGF